MTGRVGTLETENAAIFSIGQNLEYYGDAVKAPFYLASEGLVHALATPVRPGQFGNLDTRINEIARRSFVAVFAIATSLLSISSYLVGGMIEAAGELLTQKLFHYIKGVAFESWNPRDFTFFDLNVCMYWGGLPIPFGGVFPAKYRMDKLEKLIRYKDADIVALQELAFGPAKDLAERLKDQYAHFYTNIGGLEAKTTFYSAGTELFIASKAPIVSEPKFIPFPDTLGEKLGFFCIETPTCWVLTAHFPDGKKEMWASRKELIDLVHSTMVRLRKETGKSCCLMGDLNIRADEYAYSGISDKFFDPGTRRYPIFNEETSTCTNVLPAIMKGEEFPKDAPFETDDYVLFNKEAEELFDVEVELGKETYDLNDPENAITDHRYYFVRVKAKEHVHDFVQAPDLVHADAVPNTYRYSIGNRLIAWGYKLEALSDYTDIQLTRLITPIRPNEFDNCTNRMLEKIRRVFSQVVYGYVLNPIARGLKWAGTVLQSNGYNLTQMPYAYIKGNAHEEWGHQKYRIYTRNACMFRGGRPIEWGGMVPAKYRTQAYADHIRSLKANLYLGQELTYREAVDLAAALKNDFAHFYLDFGPNPGKFSSGLFIASNLPFISKPRFYSFSDGGKQHSGINRGVACLETEDHWILTSHMEHTWVGKLEMSEKIRKAQLEYIATEVIPQLKFISSKPCILAGDLNFEREGTAGDEYERIGFQKYFQNPVNVEALTPETATCTNIFSDTMQGKTDTVKPLEIDDHVGVDLASADKVKLSATLDPPVIDTAVSPWPNDLRKPHPLTDHKGLLIEVEALS